VCLDDKAGFRSDQLFSFGYLGGGGGGGGRRRRRVVEEGGGGGGGERKAQHPFHQ